MSTSVLNEKVVSFNGAPVRVVLNFPESHVPIASFSNNILCSTSFDASSEDSLTLDTFQSLILESVRQQKDFIIAQVITCDTNDRSKEYSSFYYAHSLNKLIFKIEAKRNRLHRIRANNPLNNVSIDQVIYHRAKYTQILQTIEAFLRKYDSKQNSSVKDKLKKFLEDNKSSTSLIGKETTVCENIKKTAHLAKGSSSTRTSASCSSIFDKDPDIMCLDFEAFSNDLDFLADYNIREYFKTNSLQDDDSHLFDISGAGRSFPSQEYLAAPEGTYQNMTSTSLVENFRNVYNNRVLKSKKLLIGFYSILALCVISPIILFLFITPLLALLISFGIWIVTSVIITLVFFLIKTYENAPVNQENSAGDIV